MLLNVNFLVFASNDERSICIKSIKQYINIKENKVIFAGQVKIKRGNINIHADKIIVTRKNGKNGHEIIEGYGNPIIFYQLDDKNNHQIDGHSFKIYYEIFNESIKLMGNAYIKYLDSNINSDYIIYLVKKQQIIASSNKGKLVTTILGSTKNSKNSNIRDNNSKSIK